MSECINREKLNLSAVLCLFRGEEQVIWCEERKQGSVIHTFVMCFLIHYTLANIWINGCKINVMSPVVYIIIIILGERADSNC